MTEKMIRISKVSSNRQVTIPKLVLKKLDIKKGDQIVWIEENGKILVRKV